MNKPVYLGLSILELSKIIMYDFWYDYAKPKYGEKAKLYYMGTNSSIAYIKTDDIYKDIKLCGNPQSFCSKKNNKSIVIFDNMDIINFMESCCGKGTAIKNEAMREVMKKKKQSSSSQ